MAKWKWIGCVKTVILRQLGFGSVMEIVALLSTGRKNLGPQRQLPVQFGGCNLSCLVLMFCFKCRHRHLEEISPLWHPMILLRRSGINGSTSYNCLGDNSTIHKVTVMQLSNCQRLSGERRWNCSTAGKTPAPSHSLSSSTLCLERKVCIARSCVDFKYAILSSIIGSRYAPNSSMNGMPLRWFRAVS
jgi:hypothetical protein